MKLRTAAKTGFILFAALAVASIAVQAQVLINLSTLTVSDGVTPYYAPLIQGANGNFYGTAAFGGSTKYTCSGGAPGCGTIFEVTPAGKVTRLYRFCSLANCADGVLPLGGLVRDSSGNFFGTTYGDGGGAFCVLGGSCGTVFEITPSGVLTTLYSFCSQAECTDGAGPSAGLVQGTDGNFYGTTTLGDTFFKITPAGVLTTLYKFCSLAKCADGVYPVGALIQGTDGNFYGTTEEGGANASACQGTGCGTVFKITPAGVLTTLYSFCSQASCTDGAEPIAGLVQAADGNFYGTTWIGGSGSACPSGPGGCGTVFEITPSGGFSTLYSFCSQTGCADGSAPRSPLIQGANGNLYGTTSLGGPNDDGTVFEMTTAGVPIALDSFTGRNGAVPFAGLLQAANGNFYGTTAAGSTVFVWAVFVEAKPALGKVGTSVVISGNGFTGATGVSFGGTAATFTVSSASEIKTKVPAGALTGTVTVATPAGSMSSPAPFDVTPQIKKFAPASGPIGTVVTLTGVSLTQTSAVTFDGVAAAFTVNSDTDITATVPPGAATGTIAISTAGGSVTSKSSFTVTQ